MKITSIIGGRPHLVKCEPVHNALRSCGVTHELVDCSYAVSDYLEFEWGNFDLPAPVAKLEATSQDGLVPSVHDVLEQSKSDLVILYGDLDATMAGAIAACRLGVPIVHMESGFRSGDLADSEERNRIMIDKCAALRIAFSDLMRRNLLSERLPERSIRIFENPSVLTLRNRIRELGIAEIRPSESSAGLVRIHREENLRSTALKSIVDQIADLALHYPIRFVVFERTGQALREALLAERLQSMPNIEFIETVGYMRYVQELLRAAFVVTDSSGLQDDAVFLGKPCFVLRRSTPRVDGLMRGNVLVADLAGVRLSNLVNAHANRGIVKSVEQTQLPIYDSSFVDLISAVPAG
jgi:UDP-N-acetylglucosamine 2-epimerase (non-hydrolysing)